MIHNGNRKIKYSLYQRDSNLLAYITLNRLENGYETVSNIKLALTDTFKQLQVANKVDYVTN